MHLLKDSKYYSLQSANLHVRALQGCNSQHHDMQLSWQEYVQEEQTINPFLRTEEPALQRFTGASNPVEILGALRKAKDSF